MAELYGTAKKVVGMTATLINGYSSGIFHLLYRICPAQMRKDNKRYENPSKFDAEYNDVLIQEFPYKENTPESVGRWRPLIEELVKLTLAKYRTLDGLARAYPQWVPEETVLPFPRQALESAEHIIFHDNGICEMIPRAGSSKANIVPPTAADCGEEC